MAAKAKFITHRQAIYVNSNTGRFCSAKYAKAHPKTTKKKFVTIKHKV